MSFKQKFLRFNQALARVLVAILTPILLSILWVAIGVSCIIPRLIGTEFLKPFTPEDDSHWDEHSPVDTSLRGMRRQG